MKVLLVNKFFFPGRGAETIFLETKKLLEQHGHQTAVFAMKHPNNLQSKYEKYFVGKVETQNFSLVNIFKLVKILYSFEAARKIKQILIDFKPDIVHLHNIYHQISPSILPIIKKRGVPMVLTAHDYKLICPSYKLDVSGRKCPRNIFLHALHCVVFKRHKNSWLASLAIAIEWLFYKIIRIYEHNIDLVIVPSQYVKDRFIEYGWPSQQICVVYNFVSFPAYIEKKEPGKYLLFAGGSAVEKGLSFVEKVAEHLPQIKFVVASEGQDINLSNIEFIGRKRGQDLIELYRNAFALFVPSLWSEPFGLVVLEAARQKTPSVASGLGALPELIDQESSGLLFDPFARGAVEKAAEQIRLLYDNSDMALEMGEHAQIKANEFLPQAHLTRLTAIFSDLVTKKHIK